MTIYEKMIPTKKLHYSIYWLLVGTLALFISELIPRLFGEIWDILPRIILIYEVATIVPITAIWISHSLSDALKGIDFIVEVPSKDTSYWIKSKITSIVALSTPRAKIFILFFVALLIMLVITSNLRFNSLVLTVLMIVLVQPLFFIGAHSAYAMLSLPSFLMEIANYKIKSPLLISTSQFTEGLFSLYSRVSFISLLAYCAQAFAFYYMGILNRPQSTIWLILTGFFPFTLLIFSILQIRKLNRRIKLHNIDLINTQIYKITKGLKSKISPGNTIQLLNLMEIQNKIERSKEWPFAFEGIVTLILTIVIPLAQIVISAFDMVR